MVVGLISALERLDSRLVQVPQGPLVSLKASMGSTAPVR
jgi:hypothetical protein